jgi:hypothetical protein
MNKGKEKKAEESSKIQYEANNHYSKMIIDREDMIKSRHQEHRQKSMAAFKSRKEKFDSEQLLGGQKSLKDYEEHVIAMTKLERYEDKLNRGMARSMACKSNRVNHLSNFWDQHTHRLNSFKEQHDNHELDRKSKIVDKLTMKANQVVKK